MSKTQEQVDRLVRLHKKAQDAGLDKTPEDRAVLRLLMDKIATAYARVVRERSPGGTDKE